MLTRSKDILKLQGRVCRLCEQRPESAAGASTFYDSTTIGGATMGLVECLGKRAAILVHREEYISR